MEKIFVKWLFWPFVEITKEEAKERFIKKYQNQLPSTPIEEKLQDINSFFLGIEFTKEDVEKIPYKTNRILNTLDEFLQNTENKTKEVKKIVYPSKETAYRFNILAREQLKAKLLSDINVDMQICKIEWWDIKEHIFDIKNMLDKIIVDNNL